MSYQTCQSAIGSDVGTHHAAAIGAKAAGPPVGLGRVARVKPDILQGDARVEHHHPESFCRLGLSMHDGLHRHAQPNGVFEQDTMPGRCTCRPLRKMVHLSEPLVGAAAAAAELFCCKVPPVGTGAPCEPAMPNAWEPEGKRLIGRQRLMCQVLCRGLSLIEDGQGGLSACVIICSGGDNHDPVSRTWASTPRVAPPPLPPPLLPAAAHAPAALAA